MALEDCRTSYRDLEILVEENGRRAVFANKRRKEYLVTQVDGCLLKKVLAADWVVSRRGIGDVVVELKGSDVVHGAKQVYATAEYWNQHKLRTGKIAGLIVARQYHPKANTGVQKAEAYPVDSGSSFRLLTSAGQPQALTGSE